MKPASFNRHLIVSSLVGTGMMALAWVSILWNMFPILLAGLPGLFVYLLLALVLFMPIAVQGGFCFSFLISKALVQEEISRRQLMAFLIFGVTYGALASILIYFLRGLQVGFLQFCLIGLLLTQIFAIGFVLLEDRRQSTRRAEPRAPSG